METRQALDRLREQIVACHRCPRLVRHRELVGQTKKAPYAGWEYWSRPVPGFGDPLASLMVVGLAPAAHGGNRTGRVFTGDASANFLMHALYQVGFANQPTSKQRSDGLKLTNAYLCAAVRCVPPQDRPSRQEQLNCLPYMVSELEALPRVRALLALGRVAFRSCLEALQQRSGRPLKAVFAHGARYGFGPSLPLLFASYHPSPRNTNTGRLSEESFLGLLLEVRRALGLPRPGPVP